jgi:hypothetical protein
MKLAALCIFLLPLGMLAQVTFVPQESSIAVEIDGQPFTTFHFAGAAPKPYLHPLRSASGKIITRGYPVENIAGESHDHPHHRGLWFTHGDVNGIDFWANEKGEKAANLGVITVQGKPVVAGGQKSGSIRASFEWLTPDGKPLLAEQREMVFYADPKLRLIDFDVTFTAETKVKFGDTKEGFFAIRLADQLTELKGSGHMVSAEGKVGMKEVWGKRSPWVDYAGDLNGEKVGVAILDHPANPKHPTYWHARDYGLFAANIFGEHDFYNDKTRDGGMTLQPKETLRFRYRVIIHPGDAHAADIASRFAAYAPGK